MLKTRVIPCLQLLDDNLVKTVKFKKPGYIGDAINTLRIFNELEVDELCILSIRSTLSKKPPDIKLLKPLAEECFMPLSYGGGIKDFNTASLILKTGFEKVVLNSILFTEPDLATKISEHFGSQSVIASIDVKKNLFGKYKVSSHSATKSQPVSLLEWAQKVEALGAGEIILTSVDHDGTWEGYDIELLKEVTNNVNIPVIINGGAGHLDHLANAENNGASALGLGSMVVYQSKGMGVLVNFPDRKDLRKILN